MGESELLSQDDDVMHWMEGVDLDTLRLWEERSKEQLTGRLARSLMEAQDAALAEFEQALREWEERLQETQETANEENAENAAYRKVFRRSVMPRVLPAVCLSLAAAIAVFVGVGMITATGAALALLSLAAAIAVFACWSLVPKWLGVPITTLLAAIAVFALGPLVLGLMLILCALWFMIVLLEAARRHVRHNNSRERQKEDLPDRYRHAAREFRRLATLYVQYLYWAEILSEALHRPLGTKQTHQDAEEGRLDSGENTGGLTTCVRSLLIGEAVISDDKRTELELRVTFNAVKRGWMKRSFDDRRKGWLEEYDRFAKSMGAQGSSDPEKDAEAVPQVIYELRSAEGGREIRHPLADFAERYCSGLHGDRSRDALQTELINRLSKSASTEFIDQVRTEIRGLELKPEALDNFLQGPLRTKEQPQFDSDRYVDLSVTRDGLKHKSWVGISAAVGLPEEFERLENTDVYPVGLHDDHLAFASFKLDVSDPIRVEHCRLIEPPINDITATTEKKPLREQSEFG